MVVAIVGMVVAIVGMVVATVGMAGLGPAIHDFAPFSTASRGWPAQGRPGHNGDTSPLF
jgi:hypothetical protein